MTPRDAALSALLTGGHDKKIIVWDIEKAAAALVLDGHTNTVSSLSLASNGDIVSGSWDQYVHLCFLWIGVRVQSTHCPLP